MKKRSLLAGLLTTAMLLAACSGGGTGNSGSGGTGGSGGSGARAVPQTFVVANVSDVVQWDTIDIGDSPTSLVAAQIFDRLVSRDFDGNHVPALAESWSPSEDGLVYTFNLRKGVKFHDGSDFNAEVVKWHFERILFDETAPRRFAASFGNIIKSVEKVDDYTIEMHLHQPNAAFLDLTVLGNAGFIQSKAHFEANGDKAKDTPVGTGPYKFVSWDPGQKVTLERNDNYWQQVPTLETMIIRSIEETQTQNIELETGNVHLTTKVGTENLAALERNPNTRVESTPAYNTRYIIFNVDRWPFDDIRVRQAFNLAVDMETIVKALVGDLVTYSNQVIPEASWGYNPNAVTWGYDQAKAKELLAEAGFTPGPNGILQKDGKPLKVVLHSPNGRYLMDKEINEAVKNQLTAVGVDVEIKVMEWGAYVDDASTGNYDFMFLGWAQSTPDPSLFTEALVRTGGRGNYSGFSDPDIDAWDAEAMLTTDQARRTELYHKISNRVNEHAWHIHIYSENKIYGLSNNVGNYVHSPAVNYWVNLHIEGN